MKKILCISVLGAALSAPAFSVHANEKATPDDAVALVKKAISYVKENGREKGLAEINNPKGQFVQKDTYVVVHDTNITVLAHGVNPRQVGKNMIDLKDVEGKAFGRSWSEIANGPGKGWVDYKFPNPVTKSIEQKSSYVERSGDLVFSAGIYK